MSDRRVDPAECAGVYPDCLVVHSRCVESCGRTVGSRDEQNEKNKSHLFVCDRLFKTHSMAFRLKHINCNSNS